MSHHENHLGLYQSACPFWPSRDLSLPVVTRHFYFASVSWCQSSRTSCAAGRRGGVARGVFVCRPFQSRDLSTIRWRGKYGEGQECSCLLLPAWVISNQYMSHAGKWKRTVSSRDKVHNESSWWRRWYLVRWTQEFNFIVTWRDVSCPTKTWWRINTFILLLHKPH